MLDIQFFGLTLYSIGLFLGSFIVLFLSAWIGKKVIGRKGVSNNEGDEDFRVILGATLSLLGLIIGFTLSMSISGFNSRQAAEEYEAFVIRTGFMRADLLTESSRDLMKATLREYLQQRINIYDAQSPEGINFIRMKVLDLQKVLWETAVHETTQKQTPVTSLVIASINEIVLAQQKTFAGWRHQIPLAAWILLVVIAINCNILIGYNARKVKGKLGLLFILPAMISLSFLMIAEIDAPGKGIIKVTPINLQALANMLNKEL
ncbi:hypothetical protein KFE26_02490 [Shewanella sp. M16]|uniref:bestrophin-like domain n=1 Tax=Shewanella sp. M16 TaxID=2830837 RepID=UPI001BB02D41|nr:hypothetical protein [Shewanella sp. M16]MBS0041181.1 hypothetical protein [Shewanella sp. M16]